jgi:hypothetical protein
MIRITVEQRLRVELVTMEWYDPDDQKWKLFGQVPGVPGDIISIGDEEGNGSSTAMVYIS